MELLGRPLLARVADDLQVFEPLAVLERRAAPGTAGGPARSPEAPITTSVGLPMPEATRDDARHDTATRNQPRLPGLGERPAASGCTRAASGSARLPLGWTAEAYGTDAITPLTWLMAHTETHELRLRDHADAGALAGDDRDDRGHARRDERRPLPARPRRVGTAGRRRLARPAVRQAARQDARVRRDRPRDPRARSRSSTTASTTTFRTTAPARPASASR